MTWLRTSRQSRGYGRQWELARAWVLERDEWLCQCRHCKAEGRTRVATEVDHVIPKAKARGMGWTEERMNDPSNLQAINAECHKRKTIEDDEREYIARAPIGVDGYPVN